MDEPSIIARARAYSEFAIRKVLADVQKRTRDAKEDVKRLNDAIRSNEKAKSVVQTLSDIDALLGIMKESGNVPKGATPAEQWDSIINVAKKRAEEQKGQVAGATSRITLSWNKEEKLNGVPRILSDDRFLETYIDEGLADLGKMVMDSLPLFAKLLSIHMGRFPGFDQREFVNTLAEAARISAELLGTLKGPDLRGDPFITDALEVVQDIDGGFDYIRLRPREDLVRIDEVLSSVVQKTLQTLSDPADVEAEREVGVVYHQLNQIRTAAIKMQRLIRPVTNRIRKAKTLDGRHMEKMTQSFIGLKLVGKGPKDPGIFEKRELLEEELDLAQAALRAAEEAQAAVVAEAEKLLKIWAHIRVLFESNVLSNNALALDQVLDRLRFLHSENVYGKLFVRLLYNDPSVDIDVLEDSLPTRTMVMAFFFATIMRLDVSNRMLANSDIASGFIATHGAKPLPFNQIVGAVGEEEIVKVSDIMLNSVQPEQNVAVFLTILEMAPDGVRPPREIDFNEFTTNALRADDLPTVKALMDYARRIPRYANAVFKPQPGRLAIVFGAPDFDRRPSSFLEEAASPEAIALVGAADLRWKLDASVVKERNTLPLLFSGLDNAKNADGEFRKFTALLAMIKDGDIFIRKFKATDGMGLLWHLSSLGRLTKVIRYVAEKTADPLGNRDELVLVKYLSAPVRTFKVILDEIGLLKENPVIDGTGERALDFGFGSSEGTTLHAAAEGNFFRHAQLLVERGANTESLDITERTPLHYAAENGSRETVATLLLMGANENAEDGNGQVPMDRVDEEDSKTLDAFNNPRKFRPNFQPKRPSEPDNDGPGKKKQRVRRKFVL